MENRQIATNKPVLIGTKETAKELLDKMKPQFEAALGKMIGADRFARMALTALNKNPKLLECTQSSVLACLMDCAQLGLIPNSPLKQCSLIPYKTKSGYDCQLIIEFGGYCALAYRSGDCDGIAADVVYDCDVFKYQRGTTEFLQHVPALERPADAKKTACYAYIKNKNGGTVFTVMAASEVLAIRDRSQNYKASKQYNFKTPWDTDENEMFKKTAVRRVAKLANLSAEYMEAISRDGDNDYIAAEQETRIPSTTITATAKPDLTAAPTANVSEAEFSEVTGEEFLFVTDVTEKTGTGKNGKPYTLYNITLSNGNKYTTFEKSFAELARDLQKRNGACVIDAVASKQGNGFDLLGIAEVPIEKQTTELSESEQQAQDEFDLQFPQQ